MQASHALLRISFRFRGGLLHEHVAQEREGGVDLPLAALLGEDADDLPDVLGGGEVLAPVAGEVLELHEAPVLQLLETHGDVGAGEAEEGDDLVGVERTLGEEEERVDLADRAVDAPAGAHLAEVQDEGGGGGGEVHVHQYIQEFLKIQDIQASGRLKNANYLLVQ